jgi:hypothetical protein
MHMTTLDWSWEQIALRRLANTHLLRPLPSLDAVQAVRDVCGLQAQVPAAAELGVAVRTDSLIHTELQHLIDVDRSLTRTYAMRGTAYLLPTDDLPLYMAAMRHIYGSHAWFTRFGLSRQQADDLFRATAFILNGKTLDRQELITALRQEVGAWVFNIFDRTLANFVVAAAYAGVLAYGPQQGSRATFTCPVVSRSQWQDIEDEVGAKELVRRYVNTYGPITNADLARWLAIKPSEAQVLLASLGKELLAVQALGKPAWLLASVTQLPSEKIENNVRLIPQYDTYILSAGPLEHIVPAEAKGLIAGYRGGRYEGAAGVPVLLIDGMFAGTWKPHIKGKRLELTIQPLSRLTAPQRKGIEAAAVRIAGFYEASLILRA